MRRWPRLLAGLLALAALGALSGCIVFFREEPYAAPDPNAEDFVEVVAVHGPSLVWADGSVREVLGIETAGLDRFQQARLHRALAAVARLEERGYGGICGRRRPQGLLLTPRRAGTQVTASLPYAPYPLMFEWPAISLFPRRIPIRPAWPAPQNVIQMV